MSKKTLVTIVLSAMIITFKSYATIFQPMPLDKLVEESNGAAEVELKSKKTYMNKMGLIMTDFIFTVNDSYNIENSDLDGEFLKLTMTGGTINGLTSYIDGAPEFEVGEKSFLLLKKIESKIYLSNFTMGKYKIQEVEGKTYYVSTVFPFDPELGRVKKESMIDLVKSKFKITQGNYPSEKPEQALKEKSVFSMPVAEKREPAQEGFTEKAPKEGALAMWGFFALFSISGFTIWWKLKKGVSV